MPCAFLKSIFRIASETLLEIGAKTVQLAITDLHLKIDLQVALNALVLEGAKTSMLFACFLNSDYSYMTKQKIENLAIL